MFDYNFTRSGILTGNEFLFLNIVNSFSNESHLKLEQYAQIMGRSTRTIRRIIISLKRKGYLSIRYGVYKSLHLKVAQEAGILWKANMRKLKAFSKGTFLSRKRDTGVRSNIEGNKEINMRPKYWHEETKNHLGGDEIPVSNESLSIFMALVGR